VVAGAGAWFFLIRDQEDGGVVSSPTSTPKILISSTPTAPASKLITFFGQIYNLAIEATGARTTAVLDDILALNIFSASKHVLINPRDEDRNNYNFGDFLERYSVNFPINLLVEVDEKDFDLIWSKQQEKLDNKGQLAPVDVNDSRVALVVRVVNAEKTRALLLDWESSMPEDFKELLQLADATTPSTFSASSYRDVAIRYVNLSYPDHALDYAIVSANNNDDYLVLATSREQMYAIIDSLLGFLP
jgi:hypothetical protein